MGSSYIPPPEQNVVNVGDEISVNALNGIAQANPAITSTNPVATDNSVATAVSAKANLSGATFTGDVNVVSTTPIKNVVVQNTLTNRTSTLGPNGLTAGFIDVNTPYGIFGSDALQVGGGTTGTITIEADAQGASLPYITLQNYAGTVTKIQNGQFLVDTGSGFTQPYASLSGAAFTGNVTASANSITARRIIGQPNAGVAGVNIGTGGTDAASTTPGDIWIATTSLNFRDAQGSWRQCLTTSQGGIIDVNNNITPALRVTQRGTAEAFRVEDSTTPDATAFVIDANGKVGVGIAPDASAAIKVDAGGIMFSDGTTQTTSANPVTKAWVNFNGSGASPTSIFGNNIQSVVKNSTGNYTITFTNQLSNSNYAVYITGKRSGLNEPVYGFASSRLVGSVTVIVGSGSFTAADSDSLSVLVVLN